MESAICNGFAAMVGIAVASMLVTTGCTGSVDGSNTDTTSPNAELSPQAGTVSVRGVTRASDGAPVGGVKVCQGTVWWATTPSDVCVTSDASGSFLLPGVSAEQSTTIWFQKSEFLPVLRAIQTQTSDITLPAHEDMLFPTQLPGMLMGVKMDSTKGHIAFSVGAAGQMPAPAMSVIATAEDGSLFAPVYLDAKGSPLSGASSGSLGGFVNLRPGLYVLRFAASVSCSPDGLSGYPVSTPSPGVLVPVVAGTVTAPVTVTCTAQ
jgi:hypothetical protein